MHSLPMGSRRVNRGQHVSFSGPQPVKRGRALPGRNRVEKYQSGRVLTDEASMHIAFLLTWKRRAYTCSAITTTAANDSS